MRPSGSPAELERRRVLGIELLKRGLRTVEVARRLGVDPRSVRRWRAIHDRAGRAGLAARLGPGRPPKLDGRSKDQLVELLRCGAEASGFPTPEWTCPRVATVIHRDFGVRYHVDHIGRLLREIGWTR